MLECTLQTIQSYNEYRIRHSKNRRNKRNEVLKYLGGKCVNCGNDDLEVLEGDHLYNNRQSCQIVDLVKLYNLHILEESHIQLLCRNCHRKKTNMWYTLCALEKVGIPPF